MRDASYRTKSLYDWMVRLHRQAALLGEVAPAVRQESEQIQTEHAELSGRAAALGAHNRQSSTRSVSTRGPGSPAMWSA